MFKLRKLRKKLCYTGNVSLSLFTILFLCFYLSFTNHVFKLTCINWNIRNYVLYFYFHCDVHCIRFLFSSHFIHVFSYPCITCVLYSILFISNHIYIMSKQISKFISFILLFIIFIFIFLFHWCILIHFPIIIRVLCFFSMLE